MIRLGCIICILFAFISMSPGFGSGMDKGNGIGIFDTLFIASSIGIKGNVYLKQAHVLGNGSVIIHGENQNKIVSDDSEVNNLEVITYSNVSLEGELAVNQSITIQYGSFDISSGQLNLSDSTEIHLRSGGIMKSDTSIAGLPAPGGHQHLLDFSVKAILAFFQEDNILLSWKIRQQHSEPIGRIWLVCRDVACVPPEEVEDFQ